MSYSNEEDTRGTAPQTSMGSKKFFGTYIKKKKIRDSEQTDTPYSK